MCADDGLLNHPLKVFLRYLPAAMRVKRVKHFEGQQAVVRDSEVREADKVSEVGLVGEIDELD